MKPRRADGWSIEDARSLYRIGDWSSGYFEIGPPVQDLDELAQFALEGIRNEDFVIMIGRETMEAQLNDRAAKLARGECPIELEHMGLS